MQGGLAPGPRTRRVNRPRKQGSLKGADTSGVQTFSPRWDKNDATTPQAAGYMSAEPTAGDILAMWNYRLSQYDELGLRSYIAEVRELFDMRHPVRIPREYRAISREVRTPFMRDAALRIAAALTKDRPIPEVTPRDGTQSADLAADIAGRWLRAMWGAIDHERNEDSIYMSARALVRDSESVVKVVDRANAWANFPSREGDDDYLERREAVKKSGRHVLPFSARILDRLNVVFGDGEYGDEWAIEYGIYPAPLILGQYGMASVDWDERMILPQFKIGGKPVPLGYPTGQSIAAGQTLKLEYFDKNWWVVVINGKLAPGWPKPNPYRNPTGPYFRATADPVLYSLRYLVPTLDSLLTMRLNWAHLSDFPVGKLKPVPQLMQALDLPTGDNAETPQGFKFKPGYFLAPPPGYDAEWMQPPPGGQATNELVSVIRDLIDVAGIPSIFRGIGGARQAGYAVNQLMAAANLSFRQLGNSLQRQFERASEHMLDMVEDIYGESDPGETVYVLGEQDDTKMWLGIKASGNVTETVAPRDMLGQVDFRFKPVIPTDEQAMEMIGLQAMNSPRPVLSHETVLRDFFQIDDPQGEMDKIAVEKAIETDPALGALMQQAALRRAGITPPTPPPPSGLVGPDGQPIASGPPGGGPMQPNGVTAGGMPSIPAGTMPLRPTGGPNPPILPGGGPGELPPPGGRPAGAYPGRPPAGRAA